MPPGPVAAPSSGHTGSLERQPSQGRPAAGLPCLPARIGLFETDPIGSDDGWDVVLAGDTWYEPELGARMAGWLRGLAARGALVLTGDLGRSHLPSSGLVELARYSVPTSLDLEDTDSKLVRVLRFVAE